jgi:hypothetical protein
MKKVIRLTENDLVRIVKKVISEQTPPANLPWIGNDGKFIDNKGEVIKKNKEYFKLPINTDLSVDYISKAEQKLKQAGVGDAEIELLGTLIGFIPYFETAIDYKSIVDGIIENDTEKLNSGIIGLTAPFAGKVVLNLVDYFNKKLLGDKKGKEMTKNRTDIINMTNSERIKLYQKYGHGGYDKWIADGKPKL